jgi:peptide/nickel transport system substrate-binding protein
MKRFRWQILIILVTLIAVGVLLLTQQTPLNTILPEAASGGIYTEALVGQLGRLNPLLDLYHDADRAVDRLVFSSLIRFDSNGIPQADLAESWGVSADGTIYNLTIRANAYWHDGLPVTSDDVIFTLSLLRTEFSAFPADVRAMWDSVEIERLDEKNLKFILPEPFVPFLDFLTFGILPKHIYEVVPADQLASTQFNLSPVGTGPYRFDRLIVENGLITGVVLSVNASYYGRLPFIEQIVFRYYPDPAAALLAYQTGDVLGVSQISPQLIQPALLLPELSVYSSRMPRLTMVLFNLGDEQLPFFQEKKVRRALMLGLNRQGLVDRLLNSQAVVANGPFLPGTWAYYEGVERIGFDPELAIDLLREAGYILPTDGDVRTKDGVALSFTLLHPQDPLHTRLAESIQQNWQAIGVEVTLMPLPYEQMVAEHLEPREYQAALVDLDFSRAYDPDPYPFWHQAAITDGQNYSQWDNRAASEYLEQARVIADPEVRLRLYRNFQVIFARELPALPLFFPVTSFGADIRVQGMQAIPSFEPADRFNLVDNWFLVTKRSTAQGTDVP